MRMSVGDFVRNATPSCLKCNVWFRGAVTKVTTLMVADPGEAADPA